VSQVRILVATMCRAAPTETMTIRATGIDRVNQICKVTGWVCTRRQLNSLTNWVAGLDLMMSYLMARLEDDLAYTEYLVGWAEQEGVGRWLARAIMGAAACIELDDAMQSILAVGRGMRE